MKQMRKIASPLLLLCILVMMLTICLSSCELTDKLSALFGKEEETTAPADTAAPETAAPAASGGCGSTIGIASLAVLAIAGGATVVATKKKED